MSGYNITFIVIAILGGALLIGFFVWIIFHRRNKRKEKERENQMEISVFAQNRGYNAENVRAGQGELTVSGSTVAETRNATAGDTVATSTVYIGEERSQDGVR